MYRYISVMNIVIIIEFINNLQNSNLFNKKNKYKQIKIRFLDTRNLRTYSYLVVVKMFAVLPYPNDDLMSKPAGLIYM